MSHRFQSQGSRRARSFSKSCDNSFAPARGQPAPATPGITKRVVREHARRIFLDRSPQRGLSVREWRLAEDDLVWNLEAEAL
jgi:hypothetical protein